MTRTQTVKKIGRYLEALELASRRGDDPVAAAAVKRVCAALVAECVDSLGKRARAGESATGKRA